MSKHRVPAVAAKAARHHLIGNALSLDFANTLYGHSGTPLHEYLHDYQDLVLWSAHAGILDEGTASGLERRAAREPDAAASVFHRAIALRETLYRIFAALAENARPRTNDLAVLDEARLEALAHSHIVRRGDRFEIAWESSRALDRMLWPIATSAAELLASDKIKRVRQCRGDPCDWLFVDTSRNHMRRWCSMTVCGNRSKVRRFLARQRTSPMAR